MTPHVKYVSICVQREITLNSGKEISAPQIIQGREFTTRDITSFTYQVMCWREFTISRLFFFFLSFLIIFSLSFPLISLPCFWFFYFFPPPLRGEKRQNIRPCPPPGIAQAGDNSWEVRGGGHTPFSPCARSCVWLQLIYLLYIVCIDPPLFW